MRCTVFALPIALLTLTTHCSADTPVSDAPVARPVRQAQARRDYSRLRTALEADRVELGVGWAAADAPARKSLLALARRRLEAAFRNELVPAWIGTAWEFTGTSDTPGQGSFACGHFVATILAHLGFDVPRLRLGQLASEHIARTFVPRSDLLRFSDKSAAHVVQAIAAHGDGIYALGLDRHAAFLDARNGDVTMCHASNLGDGTVVCEPALDAPAFESRYRVAARLFDDAMVEGWLTGRTWAPHTP